MGFKERLDAGEPFPCVNLAVDADGARWVCVAGHSPLCPAHWESVWREKERLAGLIDTPEILDFVKAVQLEAIHQRERWGSQHDAGKTDEDWFWLIGYLAGKALHNPPKAGKDWDELRLHRIVTVAAAACNWHAAVLGLTNMRPGIENPPGKEGP